MGTETCLKRKSFCTRLLGSSGQHRVTHLIAVVAGEAAAEDWAAHSLPRVAPSAEPSNGGRVNHFPLMSFPPPPSLPWFCPSEWEWNGRQTGANSLSKPREAVDGGGSMSPRRARAGPAMKGRVVEKWSMEPQCQNPYRGRRGDKRGEGLVTGKSNWQSRLPVDFLWAFIGPNLIGPLSKPIFSRPCT